MKEKYIICAFPGMGKTYFMNHHKNAVDFDRCYFLYKRKDKNIMHPTYDNARYEEDKDGNYINDPDFPNNFIDAVKKSDSKYILSCSNNDVLHALDKAGLQYYIILPQTLSKKYIDRYYDRFDDEEEYAGIKDNETAQKRYIKDIKDTYKNLKDIIQSKN